MLSFHTTFNQTKHGVPERTSCLQRMHAAFLFDSRTISTLRLSSCGCFLEISETGRTLSSAERGAREASGLPGQRTGRDI